MKPRLPLFAFLLLLTCLYPATSVTAGPAEETPLVTDGTSPFVIVLAPRAIPSEKRAAREIQSHLKQMSGAELPMVTDDQPLPAHALLVGHSRHTDALGLHPDAQSLGAEGFVLKTLGPHVAVVGTGPRGTLYGAYALLEKLGVRWFTPEITRVPARKSVTLPPLDETQLPAFEYREPYFTEAQDKDWAARLRTNGHAAHLDEETGGKLKFHHFVHTFDDLVPRDLYAQHPEYFPLIKGKRTTGYVQRCLTNPDVLKMSIERVRQWIKEQPDAQVYSVSQNDTYNACECDACKAAEARYGGHHSGLYLWFANQVAEAIEKDHPDKLISTLAYQFTEDPPTGIAPRKNVRVWLCPIAICDGHPLETCSSRASKAFLDHLTGWAKLTDTLYVWHYNTNFAHFLLPFPDFTEFPDSVRLYRRSGVRGIFFEGDYAPGGGGSDSELRSYVLAKLLWDPSADADALVTEWMQGVYSKASRPMRQWFDLLHEQVRDPARHVFIGDKPTAAYLSPQVLDAGDRLFDEAEKLADADPTAAEAIAKARLCLRYARIVGTHSVGPEFDAFLRDVRKFGIQQLNEGQSLDQWEKQYRAKAARK